MVGSKTDLRSGSPTSATPALGSEGWCLVTPVRASRRSLVLLLPLAALALVACNGAGTDLPPALSAPGDQRTTLGEPLQVSLTVTDEVPASVVVTATSSNEQVVPASGLALSGAGVTRTLTLTPSSVQSGTTTIMVSATDAAGQTGSREFALEVAVPFQGEPQLLTPQSGDPIGVAVAIDAGLVVAGGAQSAYLFELAGTDWVESQKLTPPEDNLNDVQGFGEAEAVEGDRVLVGAHETNGTSTQQGAAYLFERGPAGFESAGELLDPAPEADDRLGRAVGISGDHLLTGAPGASANDVRSGSVVAFQPDSPSGWTLLGKLTPSDATTGTVFGEVLDVSGDLLAVGDYANDERGSDAGAAYVFEREGGFWTESAKLAPPELEAGDQFGLAVAADDGWVLVGSESDDDEGSDAGAVYVFTDAGAGWQQVDKLYASDAAVNGGFGSGVALDYPYAVVAAKYDDELGQNTGAVYVFRHDGTTWHQVAKLRSPQPTTEAYFGWSVDVSGEHLVVSQLGAAVLTAVFQR